MSYLNEDKVQLNCGTQGKSRGPIILTIFYYVYTCMYTYQIKVLEGPTLPPKNDYVYVQTKIHVPDIIWFKHINIVQNTIGNGQNLKKPLPSAIISIH